jgi:hypothetical protein
MEFALDVNDSKVQEAMDHLEIHAEDLMLR